MNSNSLLRYIYIRIRNLGAPIVATLVLFGLVANLALAAEANSWWPPAVNLSYTPGRSFQTTVAHDPSTGDLFVAWTDDGIAEQEEILGRRWVSATHAWLPVENLSQSETWQRDGGPVLAFGKNGVGLLIWTRTYSINQGAPASGHDVLWRAWDGNAWSPEAVLFHDVAYLPGSPGTFYLIPVETPDSILLFITWGSGYRMTEYQNGNWSELTVWNYTDLSVMLAQLIMDDQGLLHAAAYGENSRQDGYNGHFYDAYYLTFDGVAWSQELNLSTTDGVADDVGLAFDGQKRLHFLWSDPDSRYSDESLKSAIWERVYENGTWGPNTEISPTKPAQAISDFSVVSDADSNLHLAWSEGIMVDHAHTDLDIRYRLGDGTTWGPETKVYTSTADSRYPLIVVGDDGPKITWQEVFWTGGPLYEHEVYFSHQMSGSPPDHRTMLPFVSK